jgi:hypothetical protein
MKVKIINCAWEFCGGKVKVSFSGNKNEATAKYSKCNKCGNFSIIDNNTLIKYQPNK